MIRLFLRNSLAEVLPLRVTPLLIEEFKGKMQQMPGFLQGYALVVTTFFHVHESGGTARRYRHRGRRPLG